MRDTTIHQLTQLNAEFYAQTAQAFSSTRQTPWPGWEVLLKEPSVFAETHIPSILDVGCGNGRYGRFLESRSIPHTYTGVDLDETLLSEAESYGLDVSQVDLVADLLKESSLLPEKVAQKSFDVIVVFGVLHHIPSFALRSRLLQKLGELLAPNGTLIISWWRVDNHRNLIARAIDPRTVGIDPSEIEEHDLLLPWERDVSTVRYVHVALPKEQQRMIESASLTVTHRFSADGRSGGENDYTVLKRSAR